MSSSKSLARKPSDWGARLLQNDVTGALTWEFRVPTPDGRSTTVLIPNDQTPAQILRAIQTRSTGLANKSRGAAIAFITSLQAEAGAPCLCTDRSGWKWSEPDSRSHGDLVAFATPAGVFTFRDVPYEWVGSPVAKGPGVGAAAGTLDNFSCVFERFTRRSNYLAFSMMCSLAGPLLAFAKLPEAPVINLSGESSGGKTLAARTAAAMQGHPDAIDSWDMKARGLEEKAANRNDLLFVANAAERCPPRERDLVISRITHMVSEGSSTVRSAGVQDRFPDLSWRVFTLSTSNQSGHQMAQKAGLDWDLQDDARFIDVPVPDPKQGGIFDRLSPESGGLAEQGAALAEELENALPLLHGVMLKPWIVYIAHNDPTELIENYIKFFLDRHGSPKGLEGRIARKFGLVYAAGKIANKNACLLGWPKNRPFRAVSTLYRRALAARAAQPTCPASIADFAKLISDPDLVRSVRRNKTVQVRSNRELLALKCRHNDRGVLGLRLEALRELQPNSYREVKAWLRRNGLVRHGQGGRSTSQLPFRIEVGRKAIDRPRLLLLRPAKLRAALSKLEI